MLKFVEHRIGDRRIVRLIQKWLKAGVLEDGVVTTSDKGTGQGSVISPLLANVYLHYVFDLWIEVWRQKVASGEVVVVRYADDLVVGFQHRNDAERFLAEFKERLASFALELHPDKTRLIEFGRFAQVNRQRRGEGKAATFTFLGFTHYCATNSKGYFVVGRTTQPKRMQATLRKIKAVLRERMGVREGDIVNLSLETAQSHFFDPETGQRLEPFLSEAHELRSPTNAVLKHIE